MLKPNFPKKGMGKEKWKERKGRNGKKEKEKDENKEKNIVMIEFMMWHEEKDREK